MNKKKIVVVVLFWFFIDFNYSQILKTETVEYLLTLSDSEISYSKALAIIAKSVDSQVNTSKIEATIDSLADKCSHIIKSSQSEDIMMVSDDIAEVFYQRLGFVYTQDTSTLDYYLFDKVLQTQKGTCVSLSALYLCVLERLGYKCSAVRSDRHMFVHLYGRGNDDVFLETGDFGHPFLLVKLFSKGSLNAYGREKGFWGRDLTKNEFLAEYCANLAGYYWKFKNKKKCAIYSEYALRFNQDCFLANQLKAILYYHNKNNNLAVIFFEKARTLNPMDPSLVMNYAYLLVELGQDEKAVGLIIDALEYNYDEDFTLFLGERVCERLISQGSLDLVYEFLIKINQLNPGQELFYHQVELLFDVFIEKGDKARAEKLLCAYIKNHPESYCLNCLAAGYFFSEKLYVEVLKYTEILYRCDSNDSDVLRMMAVSLLELHKIQRAEKVVRIYLFMEPDLAEPYYLLMKIYYQRGDYAKVGYWVARSEKWVDYTQAINQSFVDKINWFKEKH